MHNNRGYSIEGKRRILNADGSYEFGGTIQSYRSKNLEQLGNLAASLGIPFAGLKRSEVCENILLHFDTYTALKSIPRYSNLFRVPCGPRHAVGQDPNVPVHTAAYVDTIQPLAVNE